MMITQGQYTIVDLRDGESLYTWVKYADDELGNGMSDSPDGKRYVGLAYNKTTQTESITASDYSWSPLYDNVVVGGRNLVITHNAIADTIILDTGVNGSHSGHDLTNNPISVTPGEILTFTKKQDPDNADQYFRWRWLDNLHTYINRLTKIDDVFQWTVPAGVYYIEVSYPRGGFPKIERGNIATDWTPAPEDIQQDINDRATNTDLDNLAGIVSDVASQLDGKTDAGQFQQLKDEYDARVAQDIIDKEKLTNDLSTIEGRTTLVEMLAGNNKIVTDFINTVITESAEGIYIANKNSKTGILIASDRISFMDNDIEVAYISNQTMQINHGIFVKSATISNFKFELIPGTTILAIQWVGG